jgi:cell division protease FtsH
MKFILWLAIFMAFFYGLWNLFNEQKDAPKVLSYTKFKQEVISGHVKDVNINDEKQEILGSYIDTIGGRFKVNFTRDAEVSKLLDKHGVTYKAEPPAESPWWNTLIWISPYVLLFLFMYFLFRQAGEGGRQAFSFGRSRAKILSDQWQKVTFQDVAGVDEAKEELGEVVDFLKNQDKYKALGARIPKGILLLGAPGTGKTLMGRAIAGEAGVQFFYISGSDFVEMFVGVGASRVRDLFMQAKKASPSIIFVDEIDAVGRQRGAGLGGGHDEREQTLNQLLVEMDGFEPNSGVIMLAATNRPDILDPALLRPGRFDRMVVVDKPDIRGRKAILEVHCKGKKLAESVDLDILSRRTPGFTGADLENLLNEAALLAARAGKTVINMEDCEEAIDRVIVGPERKSRLISDKEKQIVAYHEAGHALAAKLIPEADPVRKVTVLPRGMALGVTWHMPSEDKYLRSRKELLAQITSSLAGRVAEEIVFGEISTGAANDLKVSTDIAHDMVCRFGMSEKLGPLTFGNKHEQVFLGRDIMEDRNFSEEVARQIDEEVRRLVHECYEKARNLLLENRDKLEKLVSALQEREVLEGEELDAIFQGNGTGNGSKSEAEA